MSKFAVIFSAGGHGGGYSNESPAVAPGMGVVRATRNDVVDIVPRDHVSRAESRVSRVDELWCDGNSDKDALELLQHAYAGLPIIQISTVRETTIFDRGTRSASLVKRLSLLQRKPTLSRPLFCAYWRDIHAPMASCHRHVTRYVQNHVVDDSGSPFDGIGEFQITDIDGMRADYDTEAAKAMKADVRNFAATVSTYVVRELTIC
jgi:uncharacterized protein (TIGR02118 family)